MVEKELILFEEALALKELGFDEECFGYYENNSLDNTIELWINCNNFPY